MLHSLFKRIAELKNKVQIGSQFDKINVADEIRGVKANEIMRRIKLQFDKVIRNDVDLMGPDLNEQASLKIDALNFLAKAKNAFGNLLTLSIIKTATVEPEVPAIDEEQLIAFDAVPDAGLWSVSYGAESTSDMAFNDNAAAVQAALRLIEGLEEVTVTGDYTAGFTVVFEGTAGGVDHSLLAEDTNTLTASAVPVVITITEEVAGEPAIPAVDTTGIIIAGSDIKIYCESSSTNQDVVDLIEASAPASALISATIDSGEEATSATAALNEPFSGGA